MHYNPFFKSNQLLFFSFPLFKVNINQSLKLQKIFLHPFPVDVLTNSQHKHKLGQILLKGCKCLTVFSRLASKSTRSPSGILGAAICGTTGLKKNPKKNIKMQIRLKQTFLFFCGQVFPEQKLYLFTYLGLGRSSLGCRWQRVTKKVKMIFKKV